MSGDLFLSRVMRFMSIFMVCFNEVEVKFIILGFGILFECFVDYNICYY